jgi:CRP-like cAMP-binding protein
MDIAHILTPTFPTLELVKIMNGIPRNLTLKPGDYFGHEVMLDEQKYAATVVSLQTMTGWKITRRALAQTIPLEKLRRAVNSM